MYRVHGERDPIADSSQPNEERRSECQCSAIPLTGESSFSLSVIHRWRDYNDPGVAFRRWAFRIGDEAQPLEIV